ncbi:MAG: radical SAM protein [Bacteroidia bacterium]|nr:radical SAM protein [Bacteroidia bacterium]
METTFWRLTLDTNPEDCNLACVMCEEHSPFSDFKEKLFAETGQKVRRMPKAWLEPLFRQAREMGIREIIPSTMGEPLLYKDFDYMLSLFEKYGIKCNLTTNGTFPKRTVEEWAKLIVPVTSDVKISWNGATAETAEQVMLKLDFAQAVEHVRAFIAVRDAHAAAGGNFCRVTFQLTFMRSNMHELAGIVQLAARLGVDRVKGHQLWDHFEEIKDQSFRQNAATIAEWNRYVAEAHEAAERFRKPNGEKVLLEQIIPLEPQADQAVPEHYECPFLGKELWISATGKISPCCAPDAQRQSLGDFGHYPQLRLENAVQAPAYRELMADYRQRPLCQGCNMRKPVSAAEPKPA